MSPECQFHHTSQSGQSSCAKLLDCTRMNTTLSRSNIPCRHNKCALLTVPSISTQRSDGKRSIWTSSFPFYAWMSSWRKHICTTSSRQYPYGVSNFPARRMSSAIMLRLSQCCHKDLKVSSRFLLLLSIQ